MGITITKTVKNAKPVAALITKQFPDGSSTDDTEMLSWKESDQPMANVSVSMGMTKPLQQKYENLKFTVFLSVPCKTDEVSIEEAFQFAKGWVETRVDLIHTEIIEQLS